VCWESAGDCPAWKAISASAADSDFPFHVDPETFHLGQITAYTPTCYDTRIFSASPVTAGTETSVTLEVDQATLQGVRCYSPLLTTGISHENCMELTYEAALAYCESYVDANGVSDYKLPDTSLEAGRMCGSGTCGYDTASPTWETDSAAANGQPSTIAGIWVSLKFLEPAAPVADVCFSPPEIAPHGKRTPPMLPTPSFHFTATRRHMAKSPPTPLPASRPAFQALHSSRQIPKRQSLQWWTTPSFKASAATARC